MPWERFFAWCFSYSEAVLRELGTPHHAPMVYYKPSRLIEQEMVNLRMGDYSSKINRVSFLAWFFHLNRSETVYHYFIGSAGGWAGGAGRIVKPSLLLPSFSKSTATRPSGRTQASL